MKKILVAAIVILLVTGAISAAGYVHYFRPDLIERWFGQPPERVEVLSQLNSTLAGWTTLGFRAELTGGRADNPDNQFRLVLTDGKIDATDPNKINLQTIFIAEALDPASGQNFKMSGEVRLINKLVYLKLNQIPNLGLPSLDTVENEWLRLDTVSLDSATSTATSTSSWQPLLVEGNVWQLDDFSGKEQLNDTQTYRYQFDIKQELLDGWFSRFGRLELTEGEIWLEQTTMAPRQLVLHLSAQSADNPDLNATGSIVINLRHFNQAVTITAPTEVNDLGNLFESLVPGTATTTP